MTRTIQHERDCYSQGGVWECNCNVAPLVEALNNVDAILSGWRRGIDSGHYIASEDVKRLRRYVQGALGWSDD